MFSSIIKCQVSWTVWASLQIAQFVLLQFVTVSLEFCVKCELVLGWIGLATYDYMNRRNCFIAMKTWISFFSSIKIQYSLISIGYYIIDKSYSNKKMVQLCLNLFFCIFVRRCVVECELITDARLRLKSRWRFVHTCRPTSCIGWLQDSTYRRPGQSIAHDSSGSPDWRRQDSRACLSACRCPRHPTTRRPLASPASAQSCQNTQFILRLCWKHENHETLGEINMDKHV